MNTKRIALRVGLTWLALAATTSTAAQAVEDTDAAKAAVRFQQGVELYREGNYEGALAEFRKAYQISPTYRVLYNIAQTQYALHDFVGAYKSLLQYTADGGADISADRRAQVDEMSAKLGERIGHLDISANFDGVDLRVDDVSVGTSPLSGPVPVNVGTRKVSAIKAGVAPAVRVVTVAGRETLKVALHLDDTVAASAGARGTTGSGLARTTTPAGAATSLTTAAQPPAGSGHSGLAISLTTTAVLAVATGACAYLALTAQKDLKDQINTYPNTRDRIEDARSKSRTYGYVTDALGAATLVSGGVALYFALTRDPAPAKPHKTGTVAVAPTLGGMVVQGNF